MWFLTEANKRKIEKNMNRILKTGFCILLSAWSVSAQKDLNVRVDVVYLASDDLEGRATGTRGEALAAEYIVHRMHDLGLKPKGSDGWYQSFSFSSNPHDRSKKDIQGRNVIVDLALRSR